MKFELRLKIEVGYEGPGTGEPVITFRSREGIAALLTEARLLLDDWDREYPPS